MYYDDTYPFVRPEQLPLVKVAPGRLQKGARWGSVFDLCRAEYAIPTQTMKEAEKQLDW